MKKYQTRLHLALAALLFAATASLTAETISFESANDLDFYTLTRSHTPDPRIEVTSEKGVGNPAGNGLTILPNNTGKRSAILLRPAFNSVIDKTVWSTSILLSPREFDDGNPSERKADVRIGFTATNTVNASKIEEFFNKTNHSISVVLKAEHKPGDNKSRQLQVEASSNTGSETKFGSFSQNNSTSFDDWLRVGLTVVRSSGTTFRVTLTLESLGADGTSTPVVLHSHTQNAVTNASLANATTLYAGITTQTDKTASTTTLYLDNHTVALQAIAPDAPVALPADPVTSAAANLQWTAPTSGVPTSSYRVEVSRASDNFAANTLLAADGTPGQSVGISTSGLSQLITGLSPSTNYLFRVRSINSAGSSIPSAAISFTTEATFVNSPPTLNSIANLPPIYPNAPQQTVPLTGISAGLGDTGQTVTITATSSDPAIIPHPTVSYTSPDTTGSLVFTPTGIEGSVTITVIADDGQAADNIITRTFTVVVRTPPETVDFNTASALSDEFTTSLANALYSFAPSGGTGTPPSGGAYYVAANSADNAILVLRNQPFVGEFPSSLSTSLMVNLREIDDHTTGKNKAEVRIGFSNEAAPVPSERKKFFEEGGTTRRAIQFKFTGEHDPSDGKVRQVKMQMSSHIGNNKTESAENTLSNQGQAFDHWLRITLNALPLSPTQIRLTYLVEDCGPDGTDSTPEVLATNSFIVTNADFLSAPLLHAGFVLLTQKGATTKGLYIDNHRAEVLRTAPAVPLIGSATNVTSHNALAQWSPGSGAIATSYQVELTTSTDNFAPGTFIAANGTTGQTVGVVTTSTTLQFTGLQPGTAYVYRVRGSNSIGTSGPSTTGTFTTLAAGLNSPPTLDPISDLLLTRDALGQTLPLTGITDGGELNQTLSISAVSSNPSIVPNPVTVGYTSPATTGSLSFTPVDGAVGSSTITITVNDGGANNATITRQFVVTVLDPVVTIPFTNATELDDLIVYEMEANLLHLPNVGIGASPNGAVSFQRTATSSDHVALAIRPYAYDARVTGYFETSLFVNVASLANLSTGKDKADIRLGFLTSPLPSSNLKNTFNKSQPALGVKFNIENDTTDIGKQGLIEVESFSATPSTGGGFSETKGGKTSILRPAALGHWLKISVQAIRKGSNQYELRYLVEDWGPDGTALVSRLLTGPAFTVTNGSFASDGSVYAAFQVNGEKTQSTAFLLDHYTVLANTRAPDAPLAGSAFDVQSRSFTISWFAATIGRAVTGFFVDVVRAVDGFLSGLFLGADGSSQSSPIEINDPYEENLTLTGLDPYTEYLWQVRARNDESTSLGLTNASVRTAALTYQEWLEEKIDPEDLDHPDLATLDFDGDGITTLLEYAFGGEPYLPDPGILPTVGISAANKLTITFRRLKDTTELLYTPQGVNHLTAIWQPISATILSISAPDADGYETVVVEDSVELSTVPARFLRLNVEVSP